MTVFNTVTDGDKALDPKFADLKRRCNEGTLPLAYVAMAIQEMNEGNFVIGGLLKFVGPIKLKAVRRFVVADNFKVGNVVGGRSLGWIGENFRTHFGGVVEEDVPAKVVYVWELIKSSLDVPIIKLLGGEDAPNTQLNFAHMFQMMEQGEKGKGRLDGWANFGYTRSPEDNSLWVPVWSVDGGEFAVGAYSSSRRREWLEGSRVCGG